MDAARRMFLIRAAQALNACPMVCMSAPKRGNQHRAVEEFSQPFNSRIRFHATLAIGQG